MTKYLTVYSLNLQEEFQRRASLVIERVRSLAIVLSLYFLWSSLLEDPSKSFLGYSRPQMLTYVLGLAILRALVLTNRAFDLTWEIARGRLSAILLRPVHLFGYQLALDLSDKTVRVAAAVVETAVLILIFQARLYWPQQPAHLAAALLAVALAVFLYYWIGLALASSGFWSAESIGFLWAASLMMEFCSGAFFPLDVLPDFWRGLLLLLPFPYLVYFPLNIYLERLSPSEIVQGLTLLVGWTIAFMVLVSFLWKRGLANYQAEGG